MGKLGTALVAALTLAACGTEPGDESTATGSTTTTEAGTTSATPGEPTTAEPTTGTSTGDASTTTSTTGVDEALCADYCADIMARCTGPEAQYPSADSCVRACTSFPAGARGDVSGNSYACRRYHIDAAAMDAPTHCVHAGPGGGGACGDNCEGFCAIAVSVCPTEHPSVDACLGACMGFVDDEKFDIGDVAGDTLACRLYHLTVAAGSDDDAAVHCPHTVQASPPCM
ncbi:hypothetical protein [Nannocystis punicea]|uniref:Uncharacterized protein n=1 Tax=Nannocystis punicea TaxID=2995304 RepID=A0ABY7GT54_9BACT|nr:hypothetical protein [Nannocystis poenicansa]WAS90106.1 hypothetical protein O0S08_28260 [Nannocystis poenicansa]